MIRPQVGRRPQAARRAARHPPAARRPQCAVKWDRNLKPKQEAVEKCLAHSPRAPPHAHSAGVATGTVARRLRINVHDDNNNDDNDDA